MLAPSTVVAINRIIRVEMYIIPRCVPRDLPEPLLVFSMLNRHLLSAWSFEDVYLLQKRRQTAWPAKRYWQCVVSLPLSLTPSLLIWPFQCFWAHRCIRRGINTEWAMYYLSYSFSVFRQRSLTAERGQDDNGDYQGFSQNDTSNKKPSEGRGQEHVRDIPVRIYHCIWNGDLSLLS